MGQITEAKKIYDQLTFNYFKLKGWNPFIIDLTGKAVADVIAIKGNNLAIVEIKSTREQGCDRNWTDAKNLSAALNQNIAIYLKDARRNVSNLFPCRTQNFERLYAVTVACQLFRYFHEFECLISTYTKKIPIQSLADINIPQKSAFLIVPIGCSQRAVTAMNILQSNGYIVSYSVDETSELYLLEIIFPVL